MEIINFMFGIMFVMFMFTVCVFMLGALDHVMFGGLFANKIRKWAYKRFGEVKS